MKGLDRFKKAISNAVMLHLKPVIEYQRAELSETIINSLFDLDGSRKVDRHIGARDEYVLKLFRGYLEISQCFESLEDITVYTSRFPFSRTRISRERYLQFHVGTYYSEIYMLSERIGPYIKLLNRQFRRDPRLPDVQKKCKALEDEIAKFLKNDIVVRGKHVHEVRLTDDGIERLSVLAGLSQGSDDEFSSMMKKYYRDEHRRVKKIWLDKIKENNKAIKQLLDVFFDYIYPIVFDEITTTLRYPQGARS